jgi:hypothetical protein
MNKLSSQNVSPVSSIVHNQSGPSTIKFVVDLVGVSEVQQPETYAIEGRRGKGSMRGTCVWVGESFLKAMEMFTRGRSAEVGK